MSPPHSPPAVPLPGFPSTAIWAEHPFACCLLSPPWALRVGVWGPPQASRCRPLAPLGRAGLSEPALQKVSPHSRGRGGASVPSPGLPEHEPPGPQGRALGTHGGGGVAPRRAAGTFLGPHPGPGPGRHVGRPSPWLPAPAVYSQEARSRLCKQRWPSPPQAPTPSAPYSPHPAPHVHLFQVTSLGCDPTDPTEAAGQGPPRAGGGTRHTSRALCQPTRAPHPQTRGRR